ncbi:MAG TPA: bifunctional 5,10-methylenetetrahydrofolate dehydrogenase/5,10-methenyltetrahydrofolate cyclohydrolase [Candidatus Acidoferrales bacterium]|jgi:5,10-methylene-tetrahydrofolate dehydrogenase/methenyl tetrahydrofolate cyclohydrolase|nr:bifunctional 5,10-methylenetetrahydrofolate dehydrogenase/5,10-methenyltetrahydrofolate cyclohydrolase [Candidatus Acidoferrales bacterium]
MAQIMYGKPVADQIEQWVRAEVEHLRAGHNIVPRLDVVLVGRSAASQRYVAKKMESCQRLGMAAHLHTFDDSISAGALRDEVQRLSDDPAIHGILIQLPLPAHIEDPPHGLNKFDVFDAVRGEQDVDGISRHTVPELYRAQADAILHLPATALAVRRMMAFYGVETEGRVAVVVGRNDITAKPIHHMLGGRMCNATAVWLHRFTRKQDHDEFMRAADIIVTSVGSEKYQITAEMVKRGAVVIDVATRVGADGKLHGDTDFDRVKEIASAITPVPKGVGPVTVAALMENVVRAAQFAAGLRKPGYDFSVKTTADSHV